ncbi:MAG TPA: ATP-binding cassette domain-containing protein [Nitrospiria bacterium]|nr:ATP-binding cassette domain-containing protein [Nitrospiria bacterium]
MDIIQVSHLRKEYRLGNRIIPAIKDISFTVRQGEVFGFLGPNGAGKSSTINILCTVLKPTSGTVILDSQNVMDSPHQVRKSIGVVFQDPSLDEKLTAWENLDFHARLYNVPANLKLERINMLLKLTGLGERRHDLVSSFSGGMKRRLEIARGLIHYPKVLFLDEPTIGLDPQSRTHIWGYVEMLRKTENLTIFLSTHYMEEAENCDRIAIIDHGEIITLDTPANLKKEAAADRIQIRTDQPGQAKSFIEEHFGLKVEEDEDGMMSFEMENAEQFLPEFVRSFPFSLTSLNIRRPTLDDVFLKLTGHGIRPEGADRKSLMRARVRIKGRTRN